MRHWLLAAAALIGAGVTAAQADYFIIRVNLGPGKDSKGEQPIPGGKMPNMGGPPGMMAPGRPGLPGAPGMSGPPSMQQMMQMGKIGGAGKLTQANDQEDDEDSYYDPNSLHTDIAVEVTRLTFPAKGVIRIQHKWGATWLTLNDTFVAFQQVRRPTVAREFLKQPKYAKSDKTADDWIELAGWALEHGLRKDLTSSMDHARKLDPKHPTVMLYDQVEAALARPVHDPAQVRFWKDKLSEYKIEQSAHYTLLCQPTGDNSDNGDAKDWLERLENNEQAFFEWFALHGKALPVPSSRLVGVLVRDADQFKMLHDGLGDVALEADAFLARRDNLAVFSARPLDKAYNALERSSRALFDTKGYNEELLLKAKGTKRNATAEENEDAQMRALALKVMRERAQTFSISSEGTRQLAAAVGFLPRDVKVPRWFRFGFGSFFETTRNAYWEGTGAPSWLYLEQFKKLANKDKLDPSKQALRDVVTDAYFSLPKLKPEQALFKARTMSWSLMYFLMEQHLDGIFRFTQELNALPRDMDLDPQLVLGCFTRAFDLGDAAQPGVPNVSKWSVFADEWYRYIKTKPVPCPDVSQKIDARLLTKSTNNTGTRGRGGAPGFPGAGGGFPQLPGLPGRR